MVGHTNKGITTSNGMRKEVEASEVDYAPDEFPYEDQPNDDGEINIQEKTDDDNEANNFDNLKKNGDFNPCDEPDAPKSCFEANTHNPKSSLHKEGGRQHSGKHSLSIQLLFK